MSLYLELRNRFRPGLLANLRSMLPPSSSPSFSSASFSTHPRPALQHAIEEEDDEEEEEGDDNQAVIQEERTALGKALLDPAWMHGRRRIAAPPQDGIERMNDLSRLLSGKQIRLHARRMNRRGSVEEDTAMKKKKGSQKKRGGALSEEEDEEGEWDDGGRRNTRASKSDDSSDISSFEDDDMDDDDEDGEEDEEEGPIEGEGGKAGYTMLTPTWTGKVASPPEALAYLSTRAVPNFSINLRVLRDVAAAASLPSSPSLGEAPRSFLDVGCGPGSGLLAAQTVWPDIHRLEGVDHSCAMRDLSEHLMVGKGGREGGGEGLGGGKVVLHRHLPPLLGQAGKMGAKYDVVFASWTLSELASEASRAMAVTVMWELVAEERGFLVLVEDGSPEGSRLVRSARKFVLEHQQQQQQQQQNSSAAERGGTLPMSRGGGGGGGGRGGGQELQR
ncbi:ribosomal small subunit rsm22 [Nannochloropsis oceanica]